MVPLKTSCLRTFYLDCCFWPSLWCYCIFALGYTSRMSYLRLCCLLSRTEICENCAEIILLGKNTLTIMIVVILWCKDHFDRYLIQSSVSP